MCEMDVFLAYLVRNLCEEWILGIRIVNLAVKNGFKHITGQINVIWNAKLV